MKYLTSFVRAIQICLIIALAGIMIHYFTSGTMHYEVIKGWIIESLYYGLPLFFINGYYFSSLDKIFKWNKKPKSRAIWGFIGSIVITMFTVFVLNYLKWGLYYGYGFDAIVDRKYAQFYVIALIITIIISSIMHAIAFFYKTQEQQLAYQKLKQEKLNSELGLLKSHIDPHFLFNSFNVLSGLIDENPNQAQKFLKGLSNIYRFVLENRTEDLISLSSELTFAKQYIDLQKTRFENALLATFDISNNFLEKKIPALSLQLLLENAIKHNAFDEENPLRITIQIVEDLLVVSNNKKLRKQHFESNGIGLKNIADRYRLLANKEIEIIQTTNDFTVKMPVL